MFISASKEVLELLFRDKKYTNPSKPRNPESILNIFQPLCLGMVHLLDKKSTKDINILENREWVGLEFLGLAWCNCFVIEMFPTVPRYSRNQL